RVVDLAHGWALGADARARDAAKALASSGEPSPEVNGDAPPVRRLGPPRGAELHLDDGHFDAVVAILAPLADVRDDEWVTLEASAMLALLKAASGNLEGADRRAAGARGIDAAQA